MIRFVSLLLLLVCAPLSAQPAFDVAQADRFFDVLAQNQRLRGSVALTKNGQPLYRRTFGDGNDARTRFRVGSITKVFTAVMVYQLIDEKKLSLDTKLSRFFPQIPNADRITVAHLLCHCSGLGSFPPPDAPWLHEPRTKAQQLAHFQTLQPEYEPGARSTYSNAGFILLGYTIEAVTRSTYAKQLERRITRPLGLRNTTYGGPSTDSYVWEEGKWNVQKKEHPSVAAASGSIVSTAEDLTKFMHALFTDKLISKESVREMLTPFSKDLPGSEKGIVVFTVRDLNKTAYQHLGGIDSFSSSLTYLPDDGIAMAIILNGPNYPMGKIFRFLLDDAYSRPLTVPSFTKVTLAPETLAQYEGTYDFPQIGMKIAIRKDGDQLSAQATDQEAFPLFAVSETTFSHPPSGILIEFRKSAEGAVNQLVLFQGRNEMRFTKQ